MWGGSYYGVQGICHTYSKRTLKGDQKQDALLTSITK